ncbi:MAG: elongation factor G [Candidatus Cloacimonetes bacterium]|nr:elongation factor G [Candidatus Cloacimonadota bacterium]
MMSELKQIRNIGISAHIDSGKTTLTERILFYTGRIHKIHEVRGKDGVGATMDSMELEKERGITISSAATNVSWKGYEINIIDTPGHVDFTIEVENALRVLDGAVLVLCSVGGVQSQTITVERQMNRYKIPHLCFINKMDRSGADPYKVMSQLHSKLGKNAVFTHLPIGSGEKFVGIIDLVLMKAVYYQGHNNEEIIIKEIPAELLDEAKKYQEILMETASMFCDTLMESYLEGTVDEAILRDAIRKATIARQMVPVIVGSAYKNIGARVLLDAVLQYLPAPDDVTNIAYDVDHHDREIEIESRRDRDVVAMAFKLENQQYGQLTYLRVYQGVIKKGMDLTNLVTGKKYKIGRLVKMHASVMEDIEVAAAGDIAGFFGIDCSLGDTFITGSAHFSMKHMYVPEPIISLAVIPKDKKSYDNMGKALNRFCKEDPTFKSYFDEESSETIISGMGELHLDVYIERMKREYKCDLEIGQPQVAYRESFSQEVAFDYTHKKQSGGRGQYARVAGYFRPLDDEDSRFVDKIVGGTIPSNFIPPCEKGFFASLEKGALAGFPVVQVEMVLTDGAFHAVDSSQLTFEIATKAAFREYYHKAKPYLMEPIMKVEIETPNEYRGNVMGSINQRRGIIIDNDIDEQFTRIMADIPLSEIFGYITQLRSLTQGKAELSVQFHAYKKMPKSIEEKVLDDLRRKEKKA